MKKDMREVKKQNKQINVQWVWCKSRLQVMLVAQCQYVCKHDWQGAKRRLKENEKEISILRKKVSMLSENNHNLKV
jgi:hypothetical protein